MFALCLQHSSKMVPWSRCYLVRADCWTLSILCPISEVVVRCCEEECLVLAGHCAAFLHRVTPVWRTAAEEHSAVQCCLHVSLYYATFYAFRKIRDPRLKSLTILTSLPGSWCTYFLKETKCSLAATAENICLVLTITGSGLVSQ